MNEEKNMANTGNINISEEVISVVAGVAASEVKGVSGLCTSFTGGIADFFGKKNYSKGVKVELEEKTVKICVSITVDYGCNIPDVSKEVQEKIKFEVENMTSLEVLSVDVYVNAIALPKPEKSKDNETQENK